MFEINLINDGTVNKNRVLIEKEGLWINLYFSYQTIIAFETSNGIVCSENHWSTTTGKYLNEIEPDKSKRIKPEEFQIRLDLLFRQI